MAHTQPVPNSVRIYVPLQLTIQVPVDVDLSRPGQPEINIPDDVHAFGIFGFCWGARVAIDSLVEVPEIKAAGLVHPSLWKTEDANNIKKPTILLPTKDDDDMTAFFDILNKNNVPSVHRKFDDVHHGFCAARGDLTQELNRKRVDEALDLMHKFFDEHVKQ